LAFAREELGVSAMYATRVNEHVARIYTEVRSWVAIQIAFSSK
jgi:hypothetical protein